MVNLIRNEENKIIGWEMAPVTEEEQYIAGVIRDMEFFGMGDNHPEYNGLKLIDSEKGKVMGNIKSISWILKKYQKS
jgi:hypothetical protein